MSRPRFRESREFLRGRAGEHIVAEWMKCRRGWYVIPSYDYAGEGGDKAPRLQGGLAQHPVPDLDVSRSGSRRWVEVKTKTAAILYRKFNELRHGIDERLFLHYQKVQEITGTEVWLLILEESTGDLLGQTIAGLGKPQVGTDRGNRMAYWCRDKFLPLDNFPDVAARIDELCTGDLRQNPDGAKTLVIGTFAASAIALFSAFTALWRVDLDEMYERRAGRDLGDD